MIIKKINTLNKILITSSLLFFSVLNAQVLIFADITKMYNNKEYQKVYDNLSKYLKDNLSNKRINFMLGRSAYQLGKYEDALVYYERILLEEPGNLRVRLEMAQSYFRLENYEKAKEQFEIVLEADIPTNVRKNIESSLASLEGKNKKHFFQAMFMAGLAYDSNINNDSDEGEYSIFSPGDNSFYTLNSDGIEESDKTYQLAFSLNHNYKLDNNYVLESKTALYTQRYFKYKEKDIDVFSLGTGLSKYTKDMKLSLGIDFNNIRQDDKQYLYTYIISSKLRKKINKDASYFIQLKFIQKDYAQEDYSDRDSKTYEFLNAFSIATKDFGLNTFTLTFGKEKKDRGIRTDISNSYFDFKLSNNYSISKTLSLNSYVDYKLTNYNYEDVNFLTKRKDKRFDLSLTLIKAINKNLSLGLSSSYINHKSNQEPFDYNKYSFRTNVYYIF